jgi:putative ABC transport system permease protein
MRLALTELRRRPMSFALAAGILTLLALLLNFLGGLLDGLIGSSTGALRVQSGNVMVYSNAAEASFLRSRIDPEQRAQIEPLPGVKSVGGIGLVQLGARVPGRGPRDLVGTALFGVEKPPQGISAIPSDGEVIADRFLESFDVRVGETILLGPARTPVKVIGWVDDSNYAGQGSLWGSLTTWRTVLSANVPAEQLSDNVVQALVVTADDTAAAVEAIDTATKNVTDSYSIDDAIQAIPGVSEQQGTFGQIIGVTVFVALVVVALFFALLTIERTAMYGVLKAIGAKSRTLFGGIAAQAAVLTGVAALVGGGAALALNALVPPGAIPLDLSISRVITNLVLLLIAAIVGCAFSLRRVLRVDPASAIGSGS